MSDNTKINKFIKYSIDETEPLERDTNSDTIYDDHQEEQKNIEYYENTMYIIHKALTTFANDKAYSLCEYLKISDVHTFVETQIDL